MFWCGTRWLFQCKTEYSNWNMNSSFTEILTSKFASLYLQVVLSIVLIVERKHFAQHSHALYKTVAAQCRNQGLFWDSLNWSNNLFSNQHVPLNTVYFSGIFSLLIICRWVYSPWCFMRWSPFSVTPSMFIKHMLPQRYHLYIIKCIFVTEAETATCDL